MTVLRLIPVVLALSLGLGCTPELFQKPDGEGHWILVDLVHTDLQNPVDHRLDRGVYAYQGVHGYSRLFDHLGDHGYPWTATRHQRIDAELLQGFSVLFINLLHEGSPDFEPREIEAIQDFVQAGGGLFAIADHSNVYRHAERLNPLIKPMGIEVGFHTALDSEAVAGSAWTLVRNLDAHATNDGLELISFQTGGTLLTDQGTAFLSESAFGDFWDEDNDEGFYGNWTFDGDPEVEPQGADIAVVAAAEYGQGRVMVVSDQNIYGDVWLHFADNFAHALNGFEWVAGGAPQDGLRLREQPVRGLDISVELSRAGYALGQGSANRYYGLFHHLNRHQGVTARAEAHLDRDRDVLWLPTPRETYSATDVQHVQDHLRKGRRVVLSFDLASLSADTVALMQALAPEFSFEVGGQTETLGGEPEAVSQAHRARIWPQLDGWQRLKAASHPCGMQTYVPADLDGLEVAALASVAEGQDPTASLLDVRSDWGRSLLSAGPVDLARVAPSLGGELVVILQDSFLRSGTLGGNEATAPVDEAKDAPKVLYGLLDYLRTPLSCP